MPATRRSRRIGKRLSHDDGDQQNEEEEKDNGLESEKGENLQDSDLDEPPIQASRKKRSKRSSLEVDEEDEDGAVGGDDDGSEMKPTPARQKKSSKTSSSSSSSTKRKSAASTTQWEGLDDENVDREEEDDDEEEGNDVEVVTFSQQAPETSQPTAKPRPHEQHNLNRMNSHTREKIIQAVSRLLLFKGLSGDPIDRRKVLSDALSSEDGESHSQQPTERIASAVLREAEIRLRSVFGFRIRRVPRYMEPNLPTRYKERLYVINELEDDSRGSHNRSMHSVHAECAIERGLLMLVLAFAHCKGEPRMGSRWINAGNLYRLLNGLDDRIPAEPPVISSSKKGSSTSTSASRFRASLDSDEPHLPDVDTLLDKFVQVDYLLRDKDPTTSNSRNSFSGENQPTTSAEQAAMIAYAMGPRAAMEIGRKQVVYFCAEILDEQPDPTMLAEIEADAEEEEEDAFEEERGGEEEVAE